MSMVSRQLMSGAVALAPAGRFRSLNGTKTFTRAAVAAVMEHTTLTNKGSRDSRTRVGRTDQLMSKPGSSKSTSLSLQVADSIRNLSASLESTSPAMARCTRTFCPKRGWKQPMLPESFWGLHAPCAHRHTSGGPRAAAKQSHLYCRFHIKLPAFTCQSVSISYNSYIQHRQKQRCLTNIRGCCGCTGSFASQVAFLCTCTDNQKHNNVSSDSRQNPVLAPLSYTSIDASTCGRRIKSGGRIYIQGIYV